MFGASKQVEAAIAPQSGRISQRLHWRLEPRKGQAARRVSAMSEAVSSITLAACERMLR